MRKQIIQALVHLRKFFQEKFHQYNSKLPFIIAILIALFLVVGGINLFVDLTETLQSDFINRFDRRITDFVISFRNPQLNNIFQFITDIGDLKGYLIVTALIAILFYWKFRNLKLIGEIVFVVIVSALSNIALKQVINRARPDAVHLVSVETLSYPSGHAMSAMAFYGFLIFLIYNFKLNKLLKSGLIFIFVLLIAAIGISRIYLGVHFPSDVAGGFIAGFIWVIFCIVLFHVIDLFRKRRRRQKQKAT